jgi:hypothetical protein
VSSWPELRAPPCPGPSPRLVTPTPRASERPWYLPGRYPETIDLKAVAREAAQAAEKGAILEILERVRWNRAEAARILRVSYNP